MKTPPQHPHKRHLGLLGVAIYTLLSPSGKIISGAAAATLLVGGLVTQLRPPPPPAAQAPVPTPTVPARQTQNGSPALVFTYIEVEGQPLAIVLTDSPAGHNAAGRELASASPSLDLSSGGGGVPGTRSPNPGPSSPGHGGPTARPSPPSAAPGPTAHPPGPDAPICIPTKVSDGASPRALLPPGSLPCPTRLADSGEPADNDSGEPDSFPAENEAGAPMPPLQDAPLPIVLLVPFPGNAPSPFEAPESQIPTGMDDPLNPLIPLSTRPDPLLTAPFDGQSPPHIAEASPAAVPEPSVIALMLLGLAALGWTGRRRLAPTRRA